MNKISLHASSVARVLTGVALLLVLASIAGQLAKFVLEYDRHRTLISLFYLDGEQNIPTYFSVLLMLLASLLLGIIAVLSQKQRSPHVSKWATLSLGFLAMGFDESAEIHEKLGASVKALLGRSDLGAFHFAWTIPGIALVLCLAAFFMRFVLHLSTTARLRFLLAALLYLSGALGFELIGGRYAEAHGQQNLTFSMLATVEESLEIAGLIFFIWALLKYFADTYEELRFRFKA